MTNGNIVKLLTEAGYSLDLSRFKHFRHTRFVLRIYPVAGQGDEIEVEASNLNLLCKRALKEIGKNQKHFMRKDG